MLCTVRWNLWLIAYRLQRVLELQYPFICNLYVNVCVLDLRVDALGWAHGTRKVSATTPRVKREMENGINQLTV